MAGINTAGVASVQEYKLGRGCIFLSALDANGFPGAYRDIGNVSEFNVTVETETLEHVSSRQGTRVVDVEITTQQKITGSFSIDNLGDFENLALFFAGETQDTITNPALAGITEIDTYIASVVLGRWYDVQDAAIGSIGNRAMGIVTADLTLEKDGAPDVLLVLNTDYTVDEKMGRFFLLSTASNIAAGDALNLTLAANAGAKTLDRVKALTLSSLTVALKFVEENPADADKQSEWQFRQTRLRGDGDLPLIGDEFMTASIAFTAEENTAYVAGERFLLVTTVDDT